MIERLRATHWLVWTGSVILALAAAGFGYWFGKPGGLDLFGGPPDKSASPAVTAGTGSPVPGQTGASNPLPNPDMPEPPAIDQARGYRISGYRPKDIGLPFVTRNEVTDRTLELDGDGGLVYRLEPGEDPVFQPVTTLQWAIGAHTQYKTTGKQLWLDLARASAQKILDGKTESDGAYYFPYLYEWTHADPPKYDFQPPWYSGMAQGEALAVFTQMAVEFPDEPQWREAAERTFASFLQPLSEDKPWMTKVIDGYVWFEEYVGPDPFEVFNGHVFALFGLYEYAQYSGDERAYDLFDGGATTALYALPVIRVPGEVSLYCVETERCVEGRWQNANYQRIHVAQAQILWAMTGQELFAEWAACLTSDIPGDNPWRVAELWPKPE
ncbi:MAG: D-glucuronyl C5-epimerase family protein [Bifidobacteriaceae bacterium]|jgi:hypothetical protein|nr:D-glucuronyl C5-epimerase family protein [Bifidobacteriaceae bacterium]